MERYAAIVLLFALVATLQPPTKSHQYRDDYEYNQETKAFFKLHTEETSYMQGSKICEAEGASLIVPTSIRDIAVVHAMFKEFHDIGDYVWIGDDGEVHESAEEQAVIQFSNESDDTGEENLAAFRRCPVLTREGQIEDFTCNKHSKYAAFTAPRLPYVCKVEAATAPFDPLCDVYSKEYEYKENLGSCYKVSKVAYTWNQAYSECQHEGAHLVVLNSKEESREVKRLMSSKPLVSYYYIAGIRAERTDGNTTRVFKTIFNQTLEAAGFAEWADTEPNNLSGSEYCGSVYETDGKYNDQDCSRAYGFICEKEKHT